MTVAVSNTVMSAAIPGASNPRSTSPIMAAGSPLIFRIASSHVRALVSRTYRPRTLGKVP